MRGNKRHGRLVILTNQGKGETINMEENDDRTGNTTGAQKPEQEESPSEKLEANPPTGSLVPGPENPDSPEIKEEKSPNTE
jgi:hypothetical protein